MNEELPPKIRDLSQPPVVHDIVIYRKKMGNFMRAQKLTIDGEKINYVRGVSVEDMAGDITQVSIHVYANVRYVDEEAE
jgi:hypothetical protein